MGSRFRGNDEVRNGGERSRLFATEPESVVERAARWRDLGGTHASILTMGKNFRTIEAHVDYMKCCADALGKAELLPV